MEKYNIQNVNLYTSYLIMEHVWVRLLYFCTQCDHSKLFVCGLIIQIMVRRSMYYSDNCKAVAIAAQWLVYSFVLPQIQTEFNMTMTSNKREFQYVIDSLVTNSLNLICCNCLKLNYILLYLSTLLHRYITQVLITVYNATIYVNFNDLVAFDSLILVKMF
jgi:hypothetical protein